MELKDIKKGNLAIAKKKFDEEEDNAEVEFAKKELRDAQDNIDEFDRQIKNLTERKKPSQETIDKFKAKGD